MLSAHPKQLFRILADDTTFPDQWFLGNPLAADGTEIDAREYAEGARYVGPPPAIVPIGNPGKELAFSLGAFDMPVVSKAVIEIICRIAPADVECFPVEIPGSTGSYHILNAIRLLDCLDEDRSEFTRWQEGDHRSDLAGQYHTISTIRIDPIRTLNHHVFRIKDWPTGLFASDAIRDALHDIPNLGIVFQTAV